MQINFWDGITSVPGYGPIRFIDATFYKTAHLTAPPWDTAMTYNVNRSDGYFSRHLVELGVRIQPDQHLPVRVDRRRRRERRRPSRHRGPPAYVAVQLAAFRRWGMGGMFAVYAYGGLDGKFDYRPYVAGMQAAAQPGSVDSQPPTLVVGPIRRIGNSGHRRRAPPPTTWPSAVFFGSSGPDSGAATMTWSVTGGSFSTGYQWHMDWTATIPARPGQSITYIAHRYREQHHDD